MAKTVNEPEGDAVAIDGAGDFWTRDGIGWSNRRRRVTGAPWSEVTKRGTGTVRVYELQGSDNE